MKVAVIEDDELTQTIAARLLTTQVGCGVVQARNGLEGLAVIEREAPDVVLLDVSMPIMDGTEMLETLRDDARYRDLPVVIMTTTAERSVVNRLIRLGVSDFLVKPLNTPAHAKRLAQVLARLGVAPEPRPVVHRRAAGAAERPRVMIVDEDKRFRDVFCRALDDFEPITATSGVEGYRLFLERQPEVVCLGEGLTLLTEERLAAKIRESDHDHRTRMFLCAVLSPFEIRDPHTYAGVLRKVFDPDGFRREFERQVLGIGGDAEDALHELLERELPAEVEVAARQALGVMTLQDVGLVDGTDDRLAEVVAQVELTAPARGLSIKVGIAGTQNDVMMLHEKVRGTSAPFEGAAQAFGEVAATMAGRIRALLDARGVTAVMSPPRVTAGYGRRPSWDRVVWFAVDGRARFAVGIAIKKSTSTVGV